MSEKVKSVQLQTTSQTSLLDSLPCQISTRIPKSTARKKKEREQRRLSSKERMPLCQAKGSDVIEPIVDATSPDDATPLLETPPRHNIQPEEPLSPVIESPGSDDTVKLEPFKEIMKWDYGGYFYDLSYIGFKCAMEDCYKQCAQEDSNTCICPACGPCSTIRYCSEEHLVLDIKSHFKNCGEYGQSTFIHPCRMSSIRHEHIRGPPMIPAEFPEMDTVERHRQAVWFNCMHSYGSYFIFLDLLGQRADERFDPRSEISVVFQGEERDRFRRCLAVAFLDGGKALELVEYIYRMIRDYFRKLCQWTEDLDNHVRHQLVWETGYEIIPDQIGLRHACKKDWVGEEGVCHDELCKYERAKQGYDYLFAGLEPGVLEAESKHWILRAARFTHPMRLSIKARIMGEGWGDIVPESDRRLFRRGEGWDGFGSGPIELVEME